MLETPNQNQSTSSNPSNAFSKPLPSDQTEVVASSALVSGNRNQKEKEALEIAEDSRETTWSKPSFVADLFLGKFREASLFPFPEQEEADRKIGDAYCAKLRTWLVANLDGDRVDREGEIPQEVMKGLAELGAFGMKIPKKYGGLGLSQVNYTRALSVVSQSCISTAAMLSAHQSIGVPQPVRLFGTEEQKQKYLPRFCKGEVSAFALTEPGVGSDPAQMATRAEPSADGKHYIINGTKLWCTNGVIASVLVVMARTPSILKNGREKKQITAFIVEKNTLGLEVVHRCRFMGLNGIQNAVLRFKDVKVPKENIIWAEGKGLRLALTTLNAGRLSLPAVCTGGARELMRASREWGKERVQWGAAVGKHQAGAQKIATLTANAFAIEAMTRLSSLWVDQQTHDIRLEAAMTKVFSSIRSHQILDQILQLRGGRGYERADSLKARGEEKTYPIERWYRDSRINQIIEGTSEILSLFTAREALDSHLRLAGDALNPKLPALKRLSALIRAGVHYAFWYPRQWLSFSYWPAFAGLGKLGPYMRFVQKTSHRLARTTFHLMLRHGPKLEKKQLQLIRLVDITTDLFAMSATIAYAHHLEKKVERESTPGSLQLAELFCEESRSRIEQNFRAIRHNWDAKSDALAKQVLSDQYRWLEERL